MQSWLRSTAGYDWGPLQLLLEPIASNLPGTSDPLYFAYRTCCSGSKMLTTSGWNSLLTTKWFAPRRQSFSMPSLCCN